MKKQMFPLVVDLILTMQNCGGFSLGLIISLPQTDIRVHYRTPQE
jgi:hypothetical protein